MAMNEKRGGGNLMQWVTMVVMESGMRGGTIGRGFQWEIIDVKGGLEALRVEDNDFIDDEEHGDDLEKEVPESVTFTSFSLTSFLLSWVIFESLLLTTFSNFTISASSLVLFIFKEESSVFRFLRVTRVLPRLLFRS